MWWIIDEYTVVLNMSHWAVDAVPFELFTKSLKHLLNMYTSFHVYEVFEKEPLKVFWDKIKRQMGEKYIKSICCKDHKGTFCWVVS